MSQDDIERTTESTNQPGQPESVQPAASDLATQSANPAAEAGDENAPTIGTGTSIALGCIAGTVLLIGIGLIYVLIVALL